MQITFHGHEAIDAARDGGYILCSYSDPTAEGVEGLTEAEALDILAEDPALVYAKPTKALELAELVGGDGQRWETDDGRDFVAVCKLEACSRALDLVNGDRFEFADGSAIVVHEGGWDFGFPAPHECKCMVGAGHVDGCAGESWRPTHRITTPADSVLVMLDEGRAYQLEEWLASEPASYELVEGEWCLHGEAFDGDVCELPRRA